MHFTRLLAFLLAFTVSPAMAQWQVPDHAVPLGRGAGVTGFKSAAAGAVGTVLAGQGTSSNPIFASQSGVMDTLLNGTVRGSVLYRNATDWVTLAPGTSGQLLKTNGAGADPAWITASGTGTVTSAGISNSYGITLGGTNPVTTTGTVSTAVALTSATNSIGANVLLNNTANYFDGPSMAQGTTGTWFASGTVILYSTATDDISCKLWDGTTVIASGYLVIPVANNRIPMSLSGVLASPAANIRISCKDNATTNGLIIFNGSGNSKDSTISGIRIQ